MNSGHCKTVHRPIELVLSLFAMLLLNAGPASLAAENVDPLNDGSQYAYGENVGWINAEPGGDGGEGLMVGDFELTGWMWGENIGWISLSCKTTESCHNAGYGVRNDGLGNLSGEAWAENAGWILFDPEGDGQTRINSVDGTFHGQAWGENIGWVTMSSPGGPNPFVLRADWTCSPPPLPPADLPAVRLEKGNPTEAILVWAPIPEATGFDVITGRINDMRGVPGGLGASVVDCKEENLTGTATAHPQIPVSGDGYWYMVRATNCGGSGTYDSGGPGQVAPRDDEIGSSGYDCVNP